MDTLTSELPHLLKLLDDEQPDIREAVSAQLQLYGGDLSEYLTSTGIPLSDKELNLLSNLLQPSRRESLRETWFTPSKDLLEPDGDWALFEAFLRMISDFLHDGISLRPSLSDLLDDLAEDSRALNLDEPVALSQWLIEEEHFTGNKKNYYSPRNSDLAFVIENRTGIPLSLSLILILVAQRWNIPILGCNYPGHFLCWSDTPSGPIVIDPYNQSRVLPVQKIIHDNPGISPIAAHALNYPATQLNILHRLLANLAHAYTESKEKDNLLLINELSKSLDAVRSPTI